MFWRANHPAGTREFVAQIFLSILALRVNFPALPNRGLCTRFRAFRIYLLSLGRDRRFRWGRSLSDCNCRRQQRQNHQAENAGFAHHRTLLSRVDAALKDNGSAPVRVPVCTENLNPHVMVMKPGKDYM
jgi:hypothetical protein